jgi:prephenate dehydratase
MREVERKLLNVAFLGPYGTVSEQSARYFLKGVECQFLACKHISDVFMAVVNDEVDYGVVPIENTIEGSVSLHMDWIVHEVDIPIRSEWVYPSVQQLIGRRDSFPRPFSFTDVRKVFSHPMAIAQCRQFLREKLPEVETENSHSTADGVRIVSLAQETGLAAIGTELAAETYGLDILERNIQDHDNNYTRFLLLGKNSFVPSRTVHAHKTSILITLPEDYPGALQQVLSAFSWRRINLSRIESRPTKKKLGSYYFYIDIQASLESVLVPAAIAEIEAIGCQVRVLGSYPSFEHTEVQ